ncbi:MAG: indolepyruvate ferredoxin oxidoreductase subunit alpha [Planctomycetaceae bacterium]|jgi:indolepyruvate ferredoxin oxidoreductase alpha subunit|nr:indolepyruvate ferredoxin oxidoreductase subunit alpha [Planctomycetaceae bacterium]
MKLLLSGNEAIARGAYEAGITLAAGYPGTPSTEVLENVSEKYKDSIYAEWSPNEKVAFEVAAGACFSGARVITTMKHVGLNVAADPLMTLAYIGTVGGFVAVVADDPGMHSSQNEQDTRHYARFAKIPILEPSDSQEAKDFIKLGIQISEEYNTPVILRTTTRVAHSRSLVSVADRQESGKPVVFEKNPQRFVPIPAWARQMRLKVEERLKKLAAAAKICPANKVAWNNKKCGIITSGIAYQYVREVFPDVSVLKIGMPFPFPDELIRDFAAQVEKILIVEELEDFLEEHIKALGIQCEGKSVIPNIGELSPDVLDKLKFENGKWKTENSETNYSPSSILPSQLNLPVRPPVLCPGCPHRGIFYALGRLDVVVTGDIGCYSLGVAPPLSRLDTILCMGGGVSVAHGIDKAQRHNTDKQKVVGIVGDSTFFHSGITGLLDVAYNKGSSTIIVVDNRITAMTGHQDNPGSGRTLMGEATGEASIEEIGKACGIKNIRTIQPRDIKTAVAVLKEATESPEPWLIVSKAPCPLHLRKPVGPVQYIEDAACKACGACLKLGCPALEKQSTGKVRVNTLLCAGCEMCKTVCPAKAVGNA